MFLSAGTVTKNVNVPSNVGTNVNVSAALIENCDISSDESNRIGRNAFLNHGNSTKLFFLFSRYFYFKGARRSAGCLQSFENGNAWLLLDHLTIFFGTLPFPWLTWPCRHRVKAVSVLLPSSDTWIIHFIGKSISSDYCRPQFMNDDTERSRCTSQQNVDLCSSLPPQIDFVNGRPTYIHYLSTPLIVETDYIRRRRLWNKFWTKVLILCFRLKWLSLRGVYFHKNIKNIK